LAASNICYVNSLFTVIAVTSLGPHYGGLLGLFKICLGEATVVAILLAIIRYLLRTPVARWPAGRKVGHE